MNGDHGDDYDNNNNDGDDDGLNVKEIQHNIYSDHLAEPTSDSVMIEINHVSPVVHVVEPCPHQLSIEQRHH